MLKSSGSQKPDYNKVSIGCQSNLATIDNFSSSLKAKFSQFKGLSFHSMILIKYLFFHKI